MTWARPRSSSGWASQSSSWPGSRLFITPLVITLLAVESADLIFALDSIPAIFAITQDPFIVFTANAFAILGLRALYFLLAGSISKLHYLKYGLAVALVFVGLKMTFSDVLHLPIALSLGNHRRDPGSRCRLLAGAQADQWRHRRTWGYR